MAQNETTTNKSSCFLPSHAVPELETDSEITAVVCMLSVFSVIGTCGNGLVIYVYSKKRDKLTSNVFIMALALTDFITSLLIMPYTIIFVYLREYLYYDAFCKIYYFLITSNVPLSAYIMVSIAVDRYLCICHPFLHLLTIPRAKFILISLLGFVAILGLFTALMHSVYSLPAEFAHYLNSSSLPYEKCDQVYTGFCYPTTSLFSLEFTLYYQKVYSSFFLISLLLVFTLYIMIYKYVTSRRAKRRRQKNAKQYSTIMVQTETTQIHAHEQSPGEFQLTKVDQHPTKVEINENGVSTSLVPSQAAENNHHDEPNKKSVRERRDHNALANIKTAVMLFVVAVVFIVAYLPPWLMALNIIGLNKCVFYSYFVYNVVNPFIYAFMNPTFRNESKRVFAKCFMKR